MNPFDLDATGLMIWGLVAHLIADWPLQNDWMANRKAARRQRWDIQREMMGGTSVELPGRWWDRHPAAYVHAGLHGLLLALVFGWVAAPLALAHLVIDTRWPVATWSRLVRQTQPSGDGYDVGLEVRFWTDQVFHILTIALAALVVGPLS
jgi:hypothetical protein